MALLAVIGQKFQTPIYKILLSQDEVCPTCGLHEGKLVQQVVKHNKDYYYNT